MDYQNLSLLGSFQGLLIIIVLLTRKENVKANVFLSAFIGLLSFQAIIFSEGLQTMLGIRNGIGVLFHIVPFLYGPLIYFYFTFLYKRSTTINGTYLWHLIPAIISFLVGISGYYEGANDAILFFRKMLYPKGLFSHLIYDFSKIISSVLYVKFALQLKENHQHDSTNKDEHHLKWLNQLAYGTVLMTIAVSFLLNLNENDVLPHQSPYDFFFVIISLFIYWIAYKSMIQSSSRENIPHMPSLSSDKYSKSGLKNDASEKLLEKLTEYLNSSESYLDPTITLDKVSSELKEYKHHISQAINGTAGVNFYSFINEFRLQKACEKLKDYRSKNKTIESISFECGFSSKSTFNDLFKKKYGITPSQYFRS